MKLGKWEFLSQVKNVISLTYVFSVNKFVFVCIYVTFKKRHMQPYVYICCLLYRQTFFPQTSMHSENSSSFNICEAKEPIVLYLKYYAELNQEHYCKYKKHSPHVNENDSTIGRDVMQSHDLFETTDCIHVQSNGVSVKLQNVSLSAIHRKTTT